MSITTYQDADADYRRDTDAVLTLDAAEQRAELLAMWSGLTTRHKVRWMRDASADEIAELCEALGIADTIAATQAIQAVVFESVAPPAEAPRLIHRRAG